MPEEQKQEKRPFVAFAVPCYGPVPIFTVRSLISLISAAPAFANSAMITSSSAYIDLARNELWDSILGARENFPFSHVFFIDSDMVFEPKDAKALLDWMELENASIGTGVYVSRHTVGHKALVYKRQPDGLYASIDFIPKTPMDADSAGLGFCCARIEVLDAIQKTRKNLFHYRYQDGVMIGEDHCFFEDAKELGFQLRAYPVVVGHAKTEILLPRRD